MNDISELNLLIETGLIRFLEIHGFASLLSFIYLSREEVLGKLQSEEQERRWYYSQLQLIAQKISSIPPTDPNSVSLIYLIKNFIFLLCVS